MNVYAYTECMYAYIYILHYITLHYTILYYIVLYYIIYICIHTYTHICLYGRAKKMQGRFNANDVSMSTILNTLGGDGKWQVAFLFLEWMQQKQTMSTQAISGHYASTPTCLNT